MSFDAPNFKQTRLRIQEAAEYLATANENLRQRLSNASRLLTHAGSKMPTEQMQRLRTEIDECLQNAKHGDFSKVTDSELKRVAEIIMELYRFAIIDSLGVEQTM